MTAPPSPSMHVTVALLLLLFWGSPGARGAWHRAGRAEAHGWARLGKCLEYREGGERYLDCQGQGLSAVPADLHSNVDHLLLGRNRISALPDHAFSRFPNLTSLDLQQNGLSQVSPRAFAGLDRLSTLLLQHNDLRHLSEEVLMHLPRLEHLRLYGNPWNCRCPLDSLVRTLQVPSNRNLGNYAECAEPPALRGCRLRSIGPDLLCLELEENSLWEMGGSLRPVTRFEVEHPHTSAACRTRKTSTSLLDFRDRGLTNVPTDLPTDSVNIDLSKNNIKHLRAKMFLGSKGLKSLNLGSNGLEYIDTAAFAGLLYLRELDLSNNSLQYIQYGVLEDLYFIRKLELGGNPWLCDYNIHYLLYWLKVHPRVQYSGLTCHSPAEFAGWPVQDYVRTYNGECPQDQVLGQNTALEPGTQDNKDQEVETNQHPGGQQPQPLRGLKKQETVRLRSNRRQNRTGLYSNSV